MKKQGLSFVIALVAFINLLNAQNVGISDDGLPPTELLHVKSTAAAPHGILIESTVNNPILQWRQGGITQFSLGVDNADADKLKLGTTSITTNTRLTIDAAGNVGIGTTAPGFNLQIENTSPTLVLRRTVNTNAAYYGIKNLGATEIWRLGTSTTSGNDFVISSANGVNDRLHVIYGTGNVGLGIAAPSEKLDVVGNIKASGAAYWGISGTRTENRADAGAFGVGIRSGYYQAGAPAPAANWPVGAASWWHLLDIRHENSTNNYAMQFAGSFFDQDLYFRKTNNNAAQSWVKVLTTANGVDGSGTLNFVPKWTPDGTTLGNSQIFDNGTNIGIGTTAPLQKLTITGTGGVLGVDNTAAFQAKNSIGTYENYLFPRWSDNVMYLNYGSAGFNIRNNASVSTMFMTSTGNVGIGTIAPTQKLHIVGGIRIVDGLQAANKVLTSDASGNASWVDPNTLVSGDNLGNHTATTNLNMGNFSINNTTFYNVTAGNGNGIQFWQSPSYAINMGTGAEFQYGAVTGYSIKSNMNNDPIRGWTWGVDATIPVASINTQGILSLANHIQIDGQTVIDDNAGWHRSYGATGWYNGTYGGGMWMDQATYVRVFNGKGFTVPGSVGIGTTAPTFKLHVIGKIKSDGITETSDVRLKKNISTLNNSLEKIMAIRGVSYAWRVKEFPEMKLDDDEQIGVIAQEIEAILPQVVNTDSEGWKSVEYSHIVPLLIEAIKEQERVIQAQKTKLKLQQSQLSTVQTGLNNLKATVNQLLQKEGSVVINNQ